MASNLTADYFKFPENSNDQDLAQKYVNMSDANFDDLPYYFKQDLIAYFGGEEAWQTVIDNINASKATIQIKFKNISLIGKLPVSPIVGGKS